MVAVGCIWQNAQERDDLRKEFISLQPEMLENRVHKFHYPLSRMRLLLNYKKINMRNALIQSLIKTSVAARMESPDDNHTC